MSNRFRVVRPVKVLGTEETVYITPVNSAETWKDRKSVLISMVPEKGEGADVSEAVEDRIRGEEEDLGIRARTVAAHTWTTAECDVPVFASAEEASRELSGGQLAGLYLEIMAISSMTGELRALARRFQGDGSGEAGGAPAAPDGEGVRVPPV